jgi:hypothetical protein
MFESSSNCVVPLLFHLTFFFQTINGGFRAETMTWEVVNKPFTGRCGADSLEL